MTEIACPKCGSEVIYELTCHTYGGDDGWFSCLPCDSAIMYQCIDDENCCWAYTHGLNPRNPRASLNENGRPVWLTGDAPEMTTSRNFIAIPGVRSIYEFEDGKDY